MVILGRRGEKEEEEGSSGGFFTTARSTASHQSRRRAVGGEAPQDASSFEEAPPMCQLIPSSPRIGAEEASWIIIILLLCISLSRWVGDVVTSLRRAIFSSSTRNGRGDGGVYVWAHTYVSFAN